MCAVSIFVYTVFFSIILIMENTHEDRMYVCIPKCMGQQITHLQKS